MTITSSTPAARRSLATVAAAAALAAALPAVAEARSAPAASGKAWSATLVAKDSERGRLVTAARNGEVRTIVTSERAAERLRVGQRLSARVTASADGTYEAARLRAKGKAKRVKVRGAVVERNSRGTLLSAGGSVFSVKGAGGRRTGRASAAGVGAGDLVVADLDVRGGGIAEKRMRDVGDAGVIELEGIFLGLSGGALELAVERRGRVEVSVPAQLAIAAPLRGDEVELLVSIKPEGGFELIALDADDDTGIDFDNEEGEAEIEGVIEALDATSVTVRERSGGELSCAIPAGDTLSRFAIGDRVEMECAISDGGFVLEELESEDAEYEAGEDEDDNDDEHEDEDERDDD